MLRSLFFLITAASLGFLMMPAETGAAEAPASRRDLSSKYIATPTGFLMLLRKGDDVIDYLKQLAIEERIPGASITGLGFVDATLGYWDAEQKKYQPKDFKSMELATLTGSIAWEKGKPSLHVHGVVIDKEFKAHGGHVLEMQVDNGSVEITIIVHPKHLERAKDNNIDANVLVL